MFLGGTLLSWKSKKQQTVVLSSVEAEYRSLLRLCAELAWLSRLLHELDVPDITPINVHCDNQAAIYIARNPVFHERTKHLCIDCHFVRDMVQQGFLQTVHVPSNLQLADIFTKALGASHHHFLYVKLGLDSHRSP